MPSELRRLIFSNEEVLAAVADYSASGRSPLPSGSVVSCRVYGEPKVRVRVEVEDPRRDYPVVVEIEPEVIGAALLRYCIAQGIPVPKQAEKSLQVHGDNIALKLTIKARSAALPGEPGTPNGDG